MNSYSNPRLLVTGATGFLGSSLLPIALENYEVHYIVHENLSPFSNAYPHQVSLNDFSTLARVIRQIKPSIILHLAAVTDANFCEVFPWSAWKINVETTKHLALIAAQENIKLCFASTDMVFDGEKGNYTETDVATPISKYGIQKVEAEKIVLNASSQNAIFRLPLMFGSLAKKNYFAHVITALKEQKPIKLFTDEYRTICGVESVATGIITLLEKANGIFHLGGPQRISRYEFGLLAAKIFKLDSHLIMPCLQSEIKTTAPRPKDVSLNSTKAIYLGFRPKGLEEELRIIAHEATLS
ncbi:MAG: SDR family oxidoreductase [Chitinophagales bacterium]|nr:SDR family oxidoreductase [Chitinophagales bacterium]MCO5280953.1 SDR family oxidoreductase [Chitinophagales bacterium]OJV26068.1 MAG: hypothetical protein BGO32_06690 [Bacteroidetes bacterium 37-13]HRN93736.1 SDR family oxidoreductase [Chitinophagales bacterium]HRP38377.1 SDR family oxidoreductase [Chitinophagales bacterium]